MDGIYEPILSLWFRKLFKKAEEFGVSGTVIPDLPYEMSQKYEPIFKKYNKSNITFVAPTTPKERIKTLVENSSKFIYMVAYAGITGSGREEDLSQIIENIREYSQTHYI